MPQTIQPDAAVLDLGSNSFHLLLARWRATGWEALAHLTEKVQLAADLGPGGDITAGNLQRAGECLQRFAPHLRTLPRERVVLAGTEALRAASNRDEFIALATRLLGHPVTVLDGVEEAALIFAATAADPTEAAQQRRLVIDVGGASTELASGSGETVATAVSVPAGCLTWRRFFAAGGLDAAAFESAYQSARELFAAHRSIVSSVSRVVGCSGTLQALEQVLMRQGWSQGGIDRAALTELHQALLRFDHIDAVAFDGLTESRRTIFAAGAAVVMALFDGLGIEQMTLSSRSLRHGLMDRLWRQHASQSEPAHQVA
ncbi:MAG: hypothetical protein RBS88_02515 [Spongiibacteraceae bacterium]|nr:hypothetical protein [Spongiibacteraceae bacterium]